MTGGAYPIVFLDVDGTLLPFGGDPAVRRLVADVGVRLAALPCELVWATTWGEQANIDIGPRLGLPPMPVVTWEADTGPEDHWYGLHWKTRGLATWAGGRPFAWLDDEITPADQAWTHDHVKVPTFLQPINPHKGITPQNLDDLETWLRGCITGEMGE
jgi:hypothetical protein